MTKDDLKAVGGALLTLCVFLGILWAFHTGMKKQAAWDCSQGIVEAC